jgi:hypothetical protein
VLPRWDKKSPLVIDFPSAPCYYLPVRYSLEKEGTYAQGKYPKCGDSFAALPWLSVPPPEIQRFTAAGVHTTTRGFLYLPFAFTPQASCKTTSSPGPFSNVAKSMRRWRRGAWMNQVDLLKGTPLHFHLIVVKMERGRG